jgi:hypothetical protein
MEFTGELQITANQESGVLALIPSKSGAFLVLMATPGS